VVLANIYYRAVNCAETSGRPTPLVPDSFCMLGEAAEIARITSFAMVLTVFLLRVLRVKNTQFGLA